MNLHRYVGAAVLLTASLLLSTQAKAQTTLPDTQFEKVAVGVVDLEHVLNETGVAAIMRDKMATAREQAQSSLHKTRQSLMAKSQELRAKLEPMMKKAEDDAKAGKPVSMPEEAVRLRAQIAALDSIFQGATQAKTQQIQKYAEDIQAEFRLEMQPALHELGRTAGVSVILNKSAALYVDPAVDLTGRLIGILKEKPLPSPKGVPADMAKEVDLSQALKQVGVE